jgi:large conductance mechanosensitive channel
MAKDPELLSFVKKFVLSVGLGIVLGGAVQKLIDAIIGGLIMPFLGLLFGALSWESATINVGGANIKYGGILESVLYFILVIVLVYLFVKIFTGKKI